MCNVLILAVSYDYDVHVASFKFLIENNECGGNNSPLAIKYPRPDPLQVHEQKN
jgi:hypothetical protein